MTDALAQLAAGGRNVGCESCAYRKSSVTRTEATNVIRATICADAGVPFHCHVTSGVLRLDGNGKMLVCEGWKAEIRERAKSPEWRKQRRVKRAVGEYCLGLLEVLCDTPAGRKHDAILEKLKEAMRLLYKTLKRGSR